MTSARDEFVKLLTDFYEASEDQHVPRALIGICADNILTLHAHELAEKIRDVANKWEWASNGTHVRAVGAWDAADLIDPEVPDE